MYVRMYVMVCGGPNAHVRDVRACIRACVRECVHVCASLESYSQSCVYVMVCGSSFAHVRACVRACVNVCKCVHC